jgi:hypothetical protein
LPGQLKVEVVVSLVLVEGQAEEVPACREGKEVVGRVAGEGGESLGLQSASSEERREVELRQLIQSRRV